MGKKETSELQHLIELQDESPICFLINAKSGGKKGELLLRTLSRFPAIHIFDIQHLWGVQKGQGNSEVFDKFLGVLRMDKIRVVAAGGDGTVSFVCNLLDFVHFGHKKSHGISNFLHKQPPPVAILPIGVGNEVARISGWSSGFSPSNSTCFSHLYDPELGFLQNVRKGRIVDLDLWQISLSSFESTEPHNTIDLNNTQNTTDLTMLCFFSIGFDARISHRFHMLRESKPSLTQSVGMNKMWYTYFGICELFQPMDDISSYLELCVDGQQVELPPSIRTLQVFNIHSSADGVDFFGISKKSNQRELQSYERPCIHDGLLEVVATEGVMHLMAIRVGASHSRRLAQGKNITITVKRTLPIQVDGESSIVEPCSVTISHRRNVPVVCGRGSTRGII